MISIFGIVIGVIFLALVVFQMGAGSLTKQVDHAAKTNNLVPVLEQIRKKSRDAQPAAFNLAIRRLWDQYHRPLAIELVKELAQDHKDAPITQYWLNQVLTVEPAMAKNLLSHEFVEAHFLPDVAAKCGPVG